jgi:hypothetical protein
MLPLSTFNSVKERGSNGALRSHLFAKGRTRRGGSRRSFSEGGHFLILYSSFYFRTSLSDLRTCWEWDPLRNDQRFQKILAGPEPKTIRKSREISADSARSNAPSCCPSGSCRA